MTGARDDLHADKRKFRRVSLIHEIECEGDAGLFKKRLADISEGGMFIDTLSAFSPGTLIRLRFRLANSDNPIRVSGKVVYVQDKIGTGVEFTDLSPQDRARIAEFIEQSSTKKRAPEIGTSSRVLVSIPITLTWKDRSGKSHEETSTIVSLAKNGARIRTTGSFEIDATVFLHAPNGALFEGRVVWIGDDGQRPNGQIGIQCRGLAHSLGFNFP